MTGEERENVTGLTHGNEKGEARQRQAARAGIVVRQPASSLRGWSRVI
jgi:hypothetical protein